MAEFLDPVRDELDRLRTENERVSMNLDVETAKHHEARASVRRYREGSDATPPPENARPTSRQAWHILLNLPANERLIRLQALLDDAYDCDQFAARLDRSEARVDQVTDELALTRDTLTHRTRALNETGATNDTLRAQLATVRKVLDDEPLIVHSIRRDMGRTPFGRGGTLRHEPATPKIGAGACPGDNLARWVMEIRAILDDPGPVS